MFKVHEDDVSTKGKIFLVAAKLFASKGFNAVSMREISEVSGVSKPTIYYYFGSKEGVIKALIDGGLEHVYSAFSNMRELDIPVKEKFIIIIKIFFKACIEYPDFTRFFQRMHFADEEMPHSHMMEVQMKKQEDSLVQIITDGINSGELRKDLDPTMALMIMGGAMSHFMLHQLGSKEIILTDKLAENIVNTLINGLGNN